MLQRVFASSAQQMCAKIEKEMASGKPINMEAVFNQLTLDVIGKAVFNYDFDSLTTDSPVIQVSANHVHSLAQAWSSVVTARICLALLANTLKNSVTCPLGMQAVYTALKETETRATDVLAYWKVPRSC